MADAPLTPYQSNPYDDEISISELLLKLWAKRGLILILPLIFAGVTVVGLLFGKTNEQNDVSYYIELNGITLSKLTPFREDGEEDADRDANASSNTLGANDRGDGGIIARYPNGTIFSPQDLTNPTVINRLAEKTGLTAQDLAEHIDVRFGTPISNGVLAEYKVAISSNSKASAQDLAALNERYELKLNAAAKRGLQIVVNYVALDISQDEGARVAALLPKHWNHVYTKQFRTKMASDIASLRWTDRKLDITSAIGLQEADVQLQNLKQGVDLIATDERLKGIKSAEGTLAADLAGYIDDFRSIFFDPLFLGAFSKDDTLTRVYTQDLRYEIGELDREIEELNNRLADIRNFQGGTQSAPSNAGREAPQLDGNALLTVVNLAERAALSSYLQDSLDQRYDLIKRRAVSITRLERINSDAAGAQIGDDFVELAQARYGNITSNYEDILKKAQAILVAQTPSFFSVTTQPDTDGNLLDKRDLLFLALALALGALISVVVALVLPQRQGE